MKNYNDLLSELEKIKNEPITPKRKVMIMLLENLINSHALSIAYQKIKNKAGNKIDLLEGGDNGLTFFGSNDINENEKKLEELRKKFREINL
jgi:hypothetical protein